ncbi:MAG: hypothetical protein ACREN2_01105 [Candidatus Dormibacteria bacterium]
MTLVARSLRGSVFVVSLVAALAAAACGSASPPAGQFSSSAAGETTTPTAAGSTNSGGVADTASNPDRTYVCADKSTNSKGRIVAYLTVAGSDTPGAQSECSTVTQGTSWTMVASSPFHANLYTPICFITFDSNKLTARVYTAETATFAEGAALCNVILHGFGVPTLPPI